LLSANDRTGGIRTLDPLRETVGIFHGSRLRHRVVDLNSNNLFLSEVERTEDGLSLSLGFLCCFAKGDFLGGSDRIFRCHKANAIDPACPRFDGIIDEFTRFDIRYAKAYGIGCVVSGKGLLVVVVAVDGIEIDARGF